MKVLRIATLIPSGHAFFSMKYWQALLFLLLLLLLASPALALETWIENCSSGLVDQEGSVVFVSSVPSGALVTIDNNVLGTTPYQENIGLKGFVYGAHTLVLTREGYETATVRFNLCIPYLTVVRVSLVPITPTPTPTPVITTMAPPKKSTGHPSAAVPDEDPAVSAPALVTTGSLVVSSDPAGAEVILDNGAKVGISPVTFDSLLPGTHEVLIRKQGYSDESVLVAITIGETQSYAATLHPAAGGDGTAPGSGSPAKQYTPGFLALPVIAALSMLSVLRRR